MKLTTSTEPSVIHDLHYKQFGYLRWSLGYHKWWQQNIRCARIIHCSNEMNFTIWLNSQNASVVVILQAARLSATHIIDIGRKRVLRLYSRPHAIFRRYQQIDTIDNDKRLMKNDFWNCLTPDVCMTNLVTFVKLFSTKCREISDRNLRPFNKHNSIKAHGYDKNSILQIIFYSIQSNIVKQFKGKKW